MNLAQNYLAALAPGMDIIASASPAALRTPGPSQPGPVARELMRLHKTYFGDTTYTRIQARAIAEARRTGKTLTAIRYIESQLKGLPELTRWNLREELLGLDVTEDELAAEARVRVKALKDTPEKQDGVTIRRGKTKWDITITGDSEVIADMKDAVGDTIESAKKFFFDGEKAARSIKHTNVIVTLDQLVDIVGYGNHDVHLRMTNGATMTGSQWLQHHLESIGLFTLVDAVAGPINLYRTERHATWKQRQMAWAENPICAWPDCNKPADESDIHHIHAWKHGGFTNPDNLVTLCKYHNGINDDDAVIRNGNAPPGPDSPGQGRPGKRGKPKRGRMERPREGPNRGKTVWIPPSATPD